MERPRRLEASMKVGRVISSCKTLKQLEGARRYMELFYELYADYFDGSHQEYAQQINKLNSEDFNRKREELLNDGVEC